MHKLEDVGVALRLKPKDNNKNIDNRNCGDEMKMDLMIGQGCQNSQKLCAYKLLLTRVKFGISSTSINIFRCIAI